MKNSVRAPALTFAFASTIYWAGVEMFWTVLGTAYCDSLHTEPPITVDLTVSAVPAIIYAAVAVGSFHWFARRLARQLASVKGS